MHTYTVYLCARHVYSNVQSQCVLNGTGWPSDNRSGMERNERGLFRAPPGLRRDGGALYENTPSKHHCAAFIPRILWFQHIITYRSSTSTILHRHRMFDITFFCCSCILHFYMYIPHYVLYIYMFSLSFALLLTPILWLVCQFSVGFFFLSSKGTHVIFIFFFYLFFFFCRAETHLRSSIPIVMLQVQVLHVFFLFFRFSLFRYSSLLHMEYCYGHHWYCE